MANERLRGALARRGAAVTELAAACGVDPKTAERWISAGRVPYRRHRRAAASFLQEDQARLWPEPADDATAAEDASEHEIVAVHPHRRTVPRDAWSGLFSSATTEIGLLVYSGFFVADDPGLQRILAGKAADGVRIRILLGDPESDQVGIRGEDEGIDEAMAARIRHVLVLYGPLRRHRNVELRLHSTVLYSSIYRADDELLVNTHLYGLPAAMAPVLHLRRVPGGSMVTTCLDSFERVWQRARPLP